MVAIKRLATVDADFKAKMDALLAFEAAADEGIERTVASILSDVKTRGDAALAEYSADESVEQDFPAVGRHYAEEVRVTCAAR